MSTGKWLVHSECDLRDIDNHEPTNEEYRGRCGVPYYASEEAANEAATRLQLNGAERAVIFKAVSVTVPPPIEIDSLASA